MATKEELTFSAAIDENEMASAPGFSATQQQETRNDDLGVGGVEKKWHGWPGENVFRLLVPSQKVGGIIGRKGEFIKKMCEETRARIKILDAPQGSPERVVMISAKEEPDSPIPPAIDGLLQVHRRTIDGLDGDVNDPPTSGLTVSSKLLVVATQAGNLIGKLGATIKTIQESSNTIVRVLGSDDLPGFGLEDDRVVEIQGEPSGVHKAIELIASHLRKFLVDRSVIGLFEMQMQAANQPMEQQNMPPPHQSWGPPPPQGFGLTSGGGGGPGYGMNPQYMPPTRQHENYYPQPDHHPSIDKPPHQGLSMYGRDAQPPPPPQAIITQVTQHMQVPLSYADAVIGTAGANISYTRRASGATITIQETRGVPGEMTVEINGSSSQVQTAQQLIQNFMADAAAAAASQKPVSSSADPGYMYSSPPGNAGQNPGGYGGQNPGGYGGQNPQGYGGQNPGGYGGQNPGGYGGQNPGGYGGGAAYGTNYGY